MDQNHFLLFDQQQKPIRLQAERVAFYRQGKFIEVISENNELYYLFFYKNQFLTAAKAKRIRRRSYIAHAFKQGQVFDAPHPFINTLLSENHPCKIVSFKPLLKMLEKHYTPQEKAFILTFFESFIPKKTLFHEIKSIFYVYRRNGQGFLGYRIIRILMGFAPNHSLVKELSGDSMFQNYANLYKEKSEDLFEKDPIFAEKILYARKDSDQSFNQLKELLEKDSRWIDLIALYCYKLTQTPAEDYYISLISILEQHVTDDDKVSILEKLDSRLSSFPPLKQDLFNIYVNSHKIENVSHMMRQNKLTLSKAQVSTLGNVLEQLDTDAGWLNPDSLTALLSPIIDEYPEKAKALLYKFVTSLLKTHEPAYVNQWLEPFKKSPEAQQLIRKIDTMDKLSDDLDQMQTLGELFYEFGQLDKAIDCFSWEMELKPTQPKPLQWLSKIYREMGKKHESEAYQQLCINLQKHA
ncbi:tetratricopeptide repeat protein [Virgibacillus doumboii]|uniref:tetratricopeptide repeat protein n=1 Tax=Virgibacillus doumboii TaxID=2697503 RepID=UPI0013DFB8D8|nr:hypothetical protein [Virgibacillus doumboii]